MPNYNDNDFVFDNDMNQLVSAHNKNGVLVGSLVDVDSGMDVTVNSGLVVINGTKVTNAGATKTISAADSTYPRKDIITINSSGVITVTEGTPEQAKPLGNSRRQTYTPKAGNVPTDEVLLAEVWVGAAATEIAAADISDLRIFVKHESTQEAAGSDCSGSDGDTGRVLTLDNTYETSKVKVFVEGRLEKPSNLTITHNSSSSTIQFANKIYDTDEIVVYYE